MTNKLKAEVKSNNLAGKSPVKIVKRALVAFKRSPYSNDMS